MYLKSLTLKGFKSFAQPTTFAFEPGVTCVVGPNGSGKSNVVDALAWVMGEQGAKTLRGGKMEDVIFAGTSTRGPLGRAEVSLTIDNSDGALPIEYTEVTITRTLFRNGGSEYAINGRGCRLLDVQELLSDSGLGREMHVIVGQGQLDAVLHATPEERRGFIEEAAGILKHRRRKEKTLRKLDAMQANLTRLSDLAGEIRRQLKPLGRQAEVARHAQTIAAVVRDARARLLADDVVGLRAALDGFARSESERHSERVVLQEKLEQATLRMARIEAEMIGDAVDDARRTTFELESVQERLRNLSALAGQRLALLELESEQPQTAPRVTVQQLEEVRVEVERLRQGVLDANAAWIAAQRGTVAARSALDAVDEEIAVQSALVSRYDLELSTLTGQADIAASRLASVRGEVLRAQNTLDSAAQRRGAARRTLEALEDEIGETGRGPDGALDEGYERAQVAVSEAEREIERLRDELHALEREREALAGRTSALSLALDVSDGSAELIAARLDGVSGRVAERIQVRRGYEAAIAAALGAIADAVLVDSTVQADAALDAALDRELGRVELLVADSARPTFDLDVPDGAIRAGELVTAPPGVLSLLERVLVVDDIATARRLRAVLGGSDLLLVTREGAVVSDVVLSAGSGGEGSRIELVSERDFAASRLEEVETSIGRLRFELGEQTGVLRSAKEQSTLALAALREHDAARAAHTERLGRVRAQLEAATAEHGRGEKALATALERVGDSETAAQNARSALDTARACPRPVLDASARDGLQREVDAAREREIEARLAVETAQERVRAEQSRGEALAGQLAADRAAADEAARRAVIRRRQQDAAAEVTAALPAVLAAVDRSVQEARAQLVAAEAARSQHNAELHTLRREEAALRDRLQSVTESVHGLELQIYEKRLQLTGLLERAGSELGLGEDVLVAEYGPDVGVPDETGEHEEPRAYVREEQRRRLEKAQKQLGQLGRVNPLALEEFAALEQRHVFLTEQLADLTSTRRDLLTIIGELDETMQTVFASAFDDTQAAFAEVFPVLFPGGTGSIRLTDPENLLTTGIEVAVRPAGKKIERLSLLSGGERSLAAVAFMVAIFTSRPSPFYIMDEVEAALDDANLGRLLSIFQTLRISSQLIVITHQKRTMEIADALYGVSMRQDGVSAVVGQRVAAPHS
ncbi:chromosome segregation protein SMC [Rathayibacter iranicus]|uniref:Chromosome partition protein Smc n=2 Tax=Rathayibacter iranicus TaxID=59737 RepID=A0AAD1AE64_9MICO|nr:chromosome segregation protein SMC [Rathayibacter iranicus]AZZ55370.1 chromosome segregation protein SMC [Rathayibacter iranicus]MWV30900.1 chromosome segregation protein SMC [Rathayibacter iranicus NCPPB 2253 = VKM Ac-1602]PPI48158.1 chromosome segregation protein SMC [Rathayibacter iranicus]PPI61374.1 chromosome segregation protein SMC [Rathayibacter iranicus]PPI72682.1 chromosome segregation protein SMC [Rathayibacter iranicus]